MRPPDYIKMQPPTFANPWGSKTALPPPMQKNLERLWAMRVAGEGAAIPLGTVEATGIPTLGRILYALITGKPYHEAITDYYDWVRRHTVYRDLGYTPEDVARKVGGGALLAGIALTPLVATGLTRQAITEMLKRGAVGAAAAGGAVGAAAMAQRRPLSEVGQMALDAALSGAVLGDVAVRGLRALADRLKTASSADIVNKLRQLRLPDTEISEILLRRNMELESFRREIETLPMDELLRLRDKYREMLDAYISQDVSKIRNIREPRWEIEDKLSVLEDVINQRRHFPHDIDLTHAATVLNPPPRITPRIDANVRSLLQRIARAKSPDALARIEQEIANMPDDVRQFLENAIQKRLMALRGAKWEEWIKSAKTVDELARIEQEMPHDVLQRYQELIQKKLTELKTRGLVTADSPAGPTVRVEPPQGRGAVRREGSAVRREGRGEIEGGSGSQVLLLKGRGEAATVEVKPLQTSVQKTEGNRTKTEDATQTDRTVKTDDAAKTDSKTKTQPTDETDATTVDNTINTQTANQHVTTTSVADAVANAITRGELAALGARLAEAVPATALLYAVGPGYMLYVARDGFYVTTGGKTYYIPPPTKLPPGGGGGDGGGFPVWEERRARRLTGEKIRVY